MDILLDHPPITDEEVAEMDFASNGLPNLPQLGTYDDDGNGLVSMDTTTDEAVFIQPFRGDAKKEVAVAVSIIGALFACKQAMPAAVENVQGAIYNCEDKDVAYFDTNKLTDAATTAKALIRDNVVKVFAPMEHTMTVSSSDGSSLSQVLGAFSMAASGGPVGLSLYFPERKSALVVVGSEDSELTLIDPHDDPTPSQADSLQKGALFRHNIGFFDLQDYVHQYYFAESGDQTQFVADFFVPCAAAAAGSGKGKEELSSSEQPNIEKLTIDASYDRLPKHDYNTPEKYTGPSAILPNDTVIKSNYGSPDPAPVATKDFVLEPEDPPSDEGKRKRQQAPIGSPMKMESEESDEKRSKSPAPVAVPIPVPVAAAPVVTASRRTSAGTTKPVAATTKKAPAAAAAPKASAAPAKAAAVKDDTK